MACTPVPKVCDVLVFTPILRLETETIQAIFSLEWDGAISFLLQRDNPTGDSYKDHLHQYKRGQDVFMKGSYDALLVIESDVIPPNDALMRLADLDADIAYGCYTFRGGNVVNILERYYPWPKQARNMGESLTVRGLWESSRQKGVIDCSGAGLGCVLIRRHVLERVPFDGNGDSFFDWDWTQNVYDEGYRMSADTFVLCGHKDPEGVIHWPVEK